MTARVSPTIEAIETRRAVQHRAENRHRWFEPVAVPGDTRRYRPLSAILPGLGILLLTGWLLACVGAFVAGYAR